MSNNMTEKIRTIAQRDPRYAYNAYLFLYEALDYTSKKLSRQGHVTGQELAEGIRDHALAQFGGLSKLVLNTWGIHRTEDFGEMVYNLIEAGTMRKTETDKKEDFRNIYDFGEVFRIDNTSQEKP